MKKRKQSTTNFTLIEMVITISIILILTGIAIPAYNVITTNAKKTKVKAEIQNFATAIASFQLDMGRLPNSLDELVTNPGEGKKWNGPYMKRKTIPKDPWQHEYVYQVPGQRGNDSYDIICYGSDGVPGGTGSAADIDNNSDE